ncbi:MAG: tetratricopeptide repeat protein [Candidatus Kariarchaeaceae archaeon]
MVEKGDTLDSVYKSLKDGKFKEAKALLLDMNFSASDKLHIESLVLHSRILENQGKLHIKEVEEYILKAIDQNKFHDDDLLLFKIEVARAYIEFKKGRYDQGMLAIEEAERIILISDKSGDQDNADIKKFWSAELLVLKGILYGWSGSISTREFERSKEYLSQALAICEEIEYYYQLTNCLNWIALFQLYNHNLGLAKVEIEKSLAISEPRNISHSICSSQLLLGSYYWLKGEYEAAVDWYRTGRDLARRIESRWLEASAFSFAGSVKILQGDLTSAESILRQASKMFEEMGDHHYFSFNNLELGEVYLQKGNIEQALITFNEALETFIRIEDKVCRNRTYVKLGKAYQSQGLKGLALKNYENAIMIPISDDTIPITIYAWFYCDAFYNAILIAIEQDDIKRAEEYFDLLIKIDQSSENKRINYTTNLSRALILNHKGELNSARSILENLFKSEIQDNEMHELVIVKYIDILLVDYAQVPNNSVEEHINLTLGYLEDVAASKNNIPLQIEVNILKGNLQTVFNNFDEAAHILDTALRMAIDNKLIELERKVEQELENLKVLYSTSKIHSRVASSLDQRVERDVLNYLQTLSKVLQGSLLGSESQNESENQ